MLAITLENVFLFDMFYLLGFAKSIKELRKLMEKRCQVKGSALRIEKTLFCKEEGISSEGCPLAKYVIRRYAKIFAKYQGWLKLVS